jgi:hypothetical protein
MKEILMQVKLNAMSNINFEARFSKHAEVYLNKE